MLKHFVVLAILTVSVLTLVKPPIDGLGEPLCESMHETFNQAHDELKRFEEQEKERVEKGIQDSDPIAIEIIKNLEATRFCLIELDRINRDASDLRGELRILFPLISEGGYGDTCPDTRLTKEDAQANDNIISNRLAAIQGLKYPKGVKDLVESEQRAAGEKYQECLAYFEKREKDKQTAVDIGKELGIDKDKITKAVGEENIKKIYDSNCLIATAAFGSAMTPEVQMLREVRDNHLMRTSSGTSFMVLFNQYYYTFSPTVASWEKQNPVFREIVKVTITPLITSLSILQYVNIDTESGVLFFGIGVILLNIGMYFVGPAFIVVKLRKYFRKDENQISSFTK